MPRVSDLSESKHLKKTDFTPEGKVVTIKSWAKEDVSGADDAVAMKYVLYFNELEKGLALNVTNGNRIEKITGSDNFDDWPGTKIILFHDEMVEMKGKIVGGVRVRAAKGESPPNEPSDDEVASLGDQFSKDHNLPTMEEEAAQDRQAADDAGEPPF